MGRYNFAPLRVRSTAKALFDAKRTTTLPQWYDIVGDVPTSETLARPVLQAPKVKGAKKASKLFKPLPIVYPEDKLRSDFFGDHPWELARPRLVVEDSGNDAKGYDWSKIQQRGKQLDGESVVQRQMWLMRNKRISKAEAYDQARREFYKHRHLDEIRNRIAKEEAMHVGAYFAKGPLEVGVELEDKAWESWKAWANQQIEEEASMRAQMFSGPQNEDAGVSDLSAAEYENAILESDAQPAIAPGQAAQRQAVPAHA
ncbi:mitochondrial ribosomal small subunit component [Didymella glomerata]|uniref:Small ribosomal subunit protein mS23 n=1 Tax=Didymella glomerata TaxID=749621 RepID=A0A9W8WZF8_9PLEO|nr:mitochondrial ribosomal small subunit component [Didymella glomerata]